MKASVARLTFDLQAAEEAKAKLESETASRGERILILEKIAERKEELEKQVATLEQDVSLSVLSRQNAWLSILQSLQVLVR